MIVTMNATTRYFLMHHVTFYLKKETNLDNAAPSIWNALQDSVRCAGSLQIVKNGLKPTFF